MLDIISQFVYTIGKINGSGINLLGTGFLISNGQYVVTARHVVGDSDDGLVFLLPSVSSFDDYQDTTDNSCIAINVYIKYSDPFRDIVILAFVTPYFDDRTRTIPIGGTDDVSVGEEVYVLGFPHCVEGRRVLTMQTALVGAKVLLNCSEQKVKHCIINTQTRPGQSGSMIYSAKQNKIIGILIGAFSVDSGISLGGINPRELHQTTHCLSAEYICKMIGG